MVESMKQVSENYLSTEKGYADDWAAYIASCHMTAEEALDYIRTTNTQEDRAAHLVDMADLSARSTFVRNGNPWVHCYEEQQKLATMDSSAFLDKMEQLFNTGPDEVPVLGKYRVGESQRTVVSVGTRVMIREADGSDRPYAHHAMRLGCEDETVSAWFYKGLSALAQEHSVAEWLALITEFGEVNFKCMALLDRANTSAFGDPVPTRVHTDIQKGPFIVVSGHDLEDLHQLLEQTAGKGVNIYTHSEMLPAHGYPGLNKYPHLAGNFGTAWQNQQKEFADLPAPILFTTNCIMPPRESYADRVYTTSVVGYKGLRHIEEDAQGRKDFSPIIEQALALGGYKTDRSMSGINGGHMLTTGFAHAAVLAQAPQIIEAIKSGTIKHIFLVGGCDGAHPGRNYYTEFVKRTPMDTLVLTLACGKFRFNDLDLGEINGIPRILDIGQCNDAYSAVQIALALADAFGCTVNDLPLTLVLTWYEQKAVCILLTLLALGIKNICLGPTMPAFLSETVIKTLVDAYNLQPITNPQQDLDAILHRG